MNLLETFNLEQKYDGRYILKRVNLQIERGETFALIGPTGAGKTTLLKLLDLLEVPSSGTIHFDGVDVTQSRRLRLEARRRMSFVQQKPIVFTMSVYENIACGLRWRREQSEVIKRKVASALELVGMADCRNRNAKTLSGGETQRVAIARALITEPEMLFLDEPTANLDPDSTSKVEEVLARISQGQETTMVMATHDMPQGQRLASRIGFLMNGEILQMGTPDQIFYSPESREVAEFVGIENILGGVVVEKDDDLATIEVDGSTMQAICQHAVGDRIYVLIRPEDITFAPFRGTSSARNLFEGKITRVTPLGPLARIEVYCGFPLFGVVTKKSAQELDLSVGKQVYASFKATAIHTIKRWS